MVHTEYISVIKKIRRFRLLRQEFPIADHSFNGTLWSKEAQVFFGNEDVSSLNKIQC